MGPYHVIPGPLLLDLGVGGMLAAAAAASQAALPSGAFLIRALAGAAGAALPHRSRAFLSAPPAALVAASGARRSGPTLLRAFAGARGGAGQVLLPAPAADAWRAPAAWARALHGSPAAPVSGAADIVAAVVKARQQQTKDAVALMSLARGACEHAARLTPAEIRDLVVSFADLGFFDVGFKSAMAEAIIPKLSTFDPSVLADVIHAYGQAQYYDYELLTEAVSFLKANADRFDAPSLAKMLWSFGRCGFKDDALMEVMHSVAEKLAASCDSTSLADVVYAEAQMGWADQRLADLVADYATLNIATFDAGSLTRLLAGLASVGYDDDELADAAGRHACNLLESGQMSPSQLVPLMWAYGLQGHFHPGLMAHVEALLGRANVLDTLSSDELHVLVDACNNLGMHGPGVTAAAARLGRIVPTIADDKSEMPVRSDAA